MFLETTSKEQHASWNFTTCRPAELHVQKQSQSSFFLFYSFLFLFTFMFLNIYLNQRWKRDLNNRICSFLWEMNLRENSLKALIVDFTSPKLYYLKTKLQENYAKILHLLLFFNAVANREELKKSLIHFLYKCQNYFIFLKFTLEKLK